MNTSASHPLTQPAAPSIPGLVFRGFRGAADFAGIAAVMTASLADHNGERYAADAVANAFAHPANSDPLQDTLIVEVDGALIGYANTQWRIEDGGAACWHWIYLYLEPRWRGMGLEPAVQSHLERRARLVAAAAGPAGARHLLTSMVPETWHALADALLALGYAPARYFCEMQRSLQSDLPELSLPAGLEIREPLPEHYRGIWDAEVESNHDNWLSAVPDEEEYRAWAETPDLDSSLWRVAWDGDQVAGASINVAQKSEDGTREVWGETDSLFVRRPWRRRGLGRALLVASMHLFKARGMITAGLGVDTENPSGALRLYEDLGYRPYRRVVLYQKPLAT
jgi:mycothiol synthase